MNSVTSKTTSFLLLLLLFLFGFAPNSVAKSEGEKEQKGLIEFSIQLNDVNNIGLIEKENKRCIRCHKKERLISGVQAIESVGVHTSSAFFNNCTACHGNKDSHPKEGTEIIGFAQHSKLSVQQQNEQCIACHSASTIAEIEWTHDVHVDNIMCSSCHQLHSDTDPMKNIEPTDRILLCIDCHGI